MRPNKKQYPTFLRIASTVGTLCLLVCAYLTSVGCGLPEPSSHLDTDTGSQSLTSMSHPQEASKQTSIPLGQTPARYPVGTLHLYKSFSQIPWSLLRSHLLKSRTTTYTNGQNSASHLDTRYVRFRIQWRESTYQVESDLLSPVFTLSIQLVGLPMRLSCIPPYSQGGRNVSITLPPMMWPLKIQTPKQAEDIVQFEQNARDLAITVWNPVLQLWKLKQCASQGRCNSTIFSDITLDMHAEPEPSCQLSLVNHAKQAP